MTIKQVVFLLILLITLGIFTYTVRKLIRNFRLTRPYATGNWAQRLGVMLKVAIGQSKILRFPIAGWLHALVFWGFLVITLGSIEMVFDGLTGKERLFSFTGWFYDFVTASGDIMAYVIALFIIIFVIRRWVLKIRRFYGIEIKKVHKQDAFLALSLIFLLMVSLIGINLSYTAMHGSAAAGVYPISERLNGLLAGCSVQCLHSVHEVSWWAHILLIFLFANILPYSKHFHVFTSVPNVLLSRLEPLGYLPNMEAVTKEVKLMMNPETAYAPVEDAAAPARFGVKDVEDVTWKNYLDSLTCTQCGRCTSVCPANLTGKKLSPRKIFVDLRARMKEKAPGLAGDKAFDDGRSLIRDYISTEELWACTTCNACAQECPVNINHPTLILDMRRFLVMEESAAPAGLNAMFANIENNGAPWQYPPEDRLLWMND